MRKFFLRRVGTEQPLQELVTGSRGDPPVSPGPDGPTLARRLGAQGQGDYVLFFLYLHGKPLHVSILEVERQAVTNEVEAWYVGRQRCWNWVHGL